MVPSRIGKVQLPKPLRQLPGHATEVPKAVRDQRVLAAEVPLEVLWFSVDPSILTPPWTEERMEFVDIVGRR